MNRLLAIFQDQGPAKCVEAFCVMSAEFNSPHALRPHLQDLRPGRAEVWMPNYASLAGPGGRFFEGALCSAAVMAVKLMADATVPAGVSWSIKSMSVEFPDLGRYEARVVADGSAVDWNASGDQAVKVEVHDAPGRPLFSGLVTISVG